MRKFFALALAVAMVMSLAAVSFAAEVTADMDIVGPYRYDSDDNIMIAPGEKNDVIRYGGGAYYLIKIKDGTATAAEAIKNFKEVEKLKVKAEFEMGEDLVDSISIVKKYVDATATWTPAGATATAFGIASELGGATAANSGYYYFVELKVASKQTTADADIVGTFEFNRKADDDVKSTTNPITTGSGSGIGKIKDKEIDFSFNVFYKDTWLNSANRNDLELTGDVDLKYDTNYALKFNCDDEVEISFGDSKHDGTNEGTFTVDVSGQGKVFMNYNTKADEAIVAANPGVKMFFLNFNNVKFNRVGEFVYEMDDVAAAYKVVDGKLVEIKGVEIGADEVTFNTRVLESYVFADAELVNPVAAVEAPAVEAPVATNPSTGAAA